MAPVPEQDRLPPPAPRERMGSADSTRVGHPESPRRAGQDGLDGFGLRH